jgi:hypothetical protein
VAKRPRFSRWRRLPGVFRTGEHRPIGSGTELDRLILYLPARILDLAEALAEKAGVASVQEYCALLLMRALENERITQRVAEFEARRGPLEGLKEIANDPHYLAEWQRRSEEKSELAQSATVDVEPGGARPRGAAEQGSVDVVFCDDDDASVNTPAERAGLEPNERARELDAPRVNVEPAAGPIPKGSLKPMVLLMSDTSSEEILARHVGSGTDEHGFLPCLRRGQPVPAAKVAELNRALNHLEEELHGSPTIDRPLAHALHRLALESQVLLTDAWPGAFDERVIAEIRTVQEAVERILSGQDIRYYPTTSPRPGSEPPT